MPGQATMIDSYGNVVPSSEIICTEGERHRLIRVRERLHGYVCADAPSPKRSSRRGNDCHDAVVKRLLELRENYEADLRKSEAGADKNGGQRGLSDSEATPQFTSENRVKAELVERLIESRESRNPMIRMVIEIHRADRPPWQSVETYADLLDHDFSELVTANRIAAFLRVALRELEMEATHSCLSTP
jgi:hypothetical protein